MLKQQKRVMMEMKITKGIDVSNHNGKINWTKVKSSGLVDFVLIRMGYGVESLKQKDACFDYNYSECKRLGIPVGAYHYSYANTVQGAYQEAKFALKLLDGKKFEYPIFMDMEEKSQVKLSKANCTQMVKTFCDELEKHGYWAGIYSFDSFFQSNLDSSIPQRYATWVARVPNFDDAKTIVNPSAVNSANVGIHQYSFKGNIPGISGNVDLDISYKDYKKLIENAGKNGFKLNDYELTAVSSNLTKERADEMSVYLQKLGMSVSITRV